LANPPGPVSGLPPYDPDQSMSLSAASRLGLVPGHDGRRTSAAVARRWALAGFAVGPLGPRYLFPAARVGGAWRTTVPWCCTGVQFIAEAQAERHSEQATASSACGTADGGPGPRSLLGRGGSGPPVSKNSVHVQSFPGRRIGTGPPVTATMSSQCPSERQRSAARM
jgi:hypothetical protein